VVAQYKGIFGSVQAIEWLHGGTQFVTSSDITKRNCIDKSILVWDFNHVRSPPVGSLQLRPSPHADGRQQNFFFCRARCCRTRSTRRPTRVPR
jgi:hypothetical protein